jgi:hypothetical protein
MRRMYRISALLALSIASCSPDAPAEQRPLNEARQDRRCADPVDSLASFDNGFVSNEKVALDVAQRYITEVYPDDDRWPLEAQLNNGVWHIAGQLPEGSAGGAPVIDLCQSNGRVLAIYAGQ